MSNLNMLESGKRVKALREALNLTQKELADKANLSEKKIDDFEKGLINKGFDLLLNLAIALNTSADYILFLNDTS